MRSVYDRVKKAAEEGRTLRLPAHDLFQIAEAWRKSEERAAEAMKWAEERDQARAEANGLRGKLELERLGRELTEAMACEGYPCRKCGHRFEPHRGDGGELLWGCPVCHVPPND